MRYLVRFLGTKPAKCGIRRSLRGTGRPMCGIRQPSVARGARCAVSGNPPWHVAPDVRRFLVKTRRCAVVSGTGRPKCGESRSHFACLAPNATIDYRTSKPTCHRAVPKADTGSHDTARHRTSESTCHQAASEADGRLHAPAPIGPDAPSAGRSRPPHGALRRALDAARRTYRNADQRAPVTRHDKPSRHHYARAPSRLRHRVSAIQPFRAWQEEPSCHL